MSLDMDLSRHAAFHHPDSFETERDDNFDHLTALAADIFAAPVILISLIDGEDHRFIASVGVEMRSIPSEISFCTHTLLLNDTFVVPDALKDARFNKNPFVADGPKVRFYAGVPLYCDDMPVGTFCILDTKPRDNFDHTQMARLRKLADSASAMLALRRGGADKKATIRKLQEAQRKLELMEEVAGVGYWQIHVASATCFWSRGVYAIHGLNRDSYQPQIETAISLFHPEDRQRVEACVAYAMEFGQDFTFQERLIRSDGEVRIVYSRGGIERGEDGKPEYVFGILEDITEQSEFEATLREAKNNAEAHQKAKSDFLSNMSHEIRTPLTTILGYSNLLAGVANMPDDARHYIGRINKAGEALLGLITDILDFSKLEAGQVRLNPQATDLRSLTHDVLDQFSSLTDMRHIDISCDNDPQAPEWLMIDDVRIRQVLYNLVGNACKFTHAGFVRLSTLVTSSDAASGLSLRVEVRDSGPGLTPEQQAQLFSRFHQIDNSINRKFGGSGLGLSICSEIIKLMKGEIGVDSKPGEGSCFWFEIPVTAAERPVTVTADISQKPFFLEDRKVLIVDDHPINRELIRLLLTDSGLDIHEVCDGKEALDICKKTQFDLIFMDIQMPVMDGIAATRHLRQNTGLNQYTPIVALSAAAQTKLIDDTRGQGFTHILTKPIDMPQFFNTLHACLEDTETPIRLSL
ncbi:MAG: ATP-binding protein [Asticcacaulis sp.]